MGPEGARATDQDIRSEARDGSAMRRGMSRPAYARGRGDEFQNRRQAKGPSVTALYRKMKGFQPGDRPAVPAPRKAVSPVTPGSGRGKQAAGPRTHEGFVGKPPRLCAPGRTGQAVGLTAVVVWSQSPCLRTRSHTSRAIRQTTALGPNRSHYSIGRPGSCRRVCLATWTTRRARVHYTSSRQDVACRPEGVWLPVRDACRVGTTPPCSTDAATTRAGDSSASRSGPDPAAASAGLLSRHW